MNLTKVLDAIFPFIEPLDDAQFEAEKRSLAEDLAEIDKSRFGFQAEHALAEAQRAAMQEQDRVKTAESKATTYLAVLAALVPLIITLQTASWENKSGPAPEGLKLSVLFIALIYVAAAGYNAFRTLQVSGFERVAEREVAQAWRTPKPIEKMTRRTLRASRRSRQAVNLKVTYIKVTHQHLVRAFAAFVLLLSLNPITYAANAAFGELTAARPSNEPTASPPPLHPNPALETERTTTATESRKTASDVPADVRIPDTPQETPGHSLMDKQSAEKVDQREGQAAQQR